MTTLINSDKERGSHGRCDAKCYNAKGKKCKCICGAINHGKGLKRAAKKTLEEAASLWERGAFVNERTCHDVLSQQVFFPHEL